MINAILMMGLICNSQQCWWVKTDWKFDNIEKCQEVIPDYFLKSTMYHDLKCIKEGETK